MCKTAIHAFTSSLLLLALASGCGRNLSFNALTGNALTGTPLSGNPPSGDTPTGDPSTTPSSTTHPGTATLSWERPTAFTDGSMLSDLSGYRVHFGTAPGSYTATIAVNDPAANTYTVTDLAPGKTYYFAVSAVSASAGESDLSNEASKSIP